MTPRLVWVDIARGAAISLVVFGHAWRGLYRKGLIGDDLFRAVDSAVYAFHMPLFFMISGFFFFDGVRRGPLVARIHDATRHLLIPLVLWTYIFLTLRWIFSDFTNSQPDFSSLFVLPIPGILHFWFLWALWVIQVFFLTFAVFLPEQLKTGQVLMVSFLLAALVWIFAGQLPFRSYFANVYDNAIFFAFGAIAYWFLKHVRIGGIAGAFAAIVFAGLLGVTRVYAHSAVSQMLLALGLSISFLFFVKWVTEISPPGLALLQWAGFFSFSIYMMHTIFSAGVREMLVALGITAFPVHLCVALIAGMGIPVYVNLIASRYKIGALLGLRRAGN